uniref:Uncharacterized protein n=1 Tax=Haptolina brevifila TaxID=156173 RepID=A0A7S2DE99_9EUKA
MHANACDAAARPPLGRPMCRGRRLARSTHAPQTGERATAVRGGGARVQRAAQRLLQPGRPLRQLPERSAAAGRRVLHEPVRLTRAASAGGEEPRDGDSGRGSALTHRGLRAVAVSGESGARWATCKG